jgi:anti-sigma factor RsiW
MGDYIDGLLPPDQLEALERHLSACMPCITFVRTYKATCKAARANLALELPEELASSLHEFLRKAIPGFDGGSTGTGGCGVPAPALAKKGI